MKRLAQKLWYLRLLAANKTALRLLGFFSVFFVLLLLAIVLSHDAIHAEREAYKNTLLTTLTNCTDVRFVNEPVESVKTNIELSAIYRIKSPTETDCGVISEWRTQQGYSGAIDFALNFSQDGQITHMRIIGHKETPSIGDRITKAPWQQQFLGTDAAPPYDAISGATISSRAMIEAIEAARALWHNQ